MSALIYVLLFLTFITDTCAYSITDEIANSTGIILPSATVPLVFNVSGNTVVFALVYSFALLVILAVFITPIIICATSACSRDLSESSSTDQFAN